MLIHDSGSKDARFNDAGFIHKLCPSLNAMKKLMQEKKAYFTPKSSLDSSNRFDYFHYQLKATKIKRNFFLYYCIEDKFM